MKKQQDSQDYLNKKAKFNRVITIYGRNAVVEALKNQKIDAITLHLSQSNLDNKIILDIKKLANSKNITIKMYSKIALSRISKNGKQDQGVALDIESLNYQCALSYLDELPINCKIIALDAINNPRNLGMIIRSIAASKIDALLIPKKNSIKISPLVIKASAGTFFKAKILFCDTLKETLLIYKSYGFETIVLSPYAKESIFKMKSTTRSIYVLGNESNGVSQEIKNISQKEVLIPLENGVESLNTAISAALVAFSI